MKYLTIVLQGPMAAWGGITYGESRDSGVQPNRSALIGLVAAAFGYRRDQNMEIQRLAERLAFATVLANPGVKIRDYHTIQFEEYKAGRTIRRFTRADELRDGRLTTKLSKREYYCDQVLCVLMWTRNAQDDILESVAEAIKKPKFTLFLGRKSCPPARPMTPRFVEADTLKQAVTKALARLNDERHQFTDTRGFVHFPWRKLLDHPRRLGQRSTSRSVRVLWDQTTDLGLDTSKESMGVTQRRDEPLSRISWQFGLRDEFSAEMMVEDLALTERESAPFDDFTLDIADLAGIVADDDSGGEASDSSGTGVGNG